MGHLNQGEAFFTMNGTRRKYASLLLIDCAILFSKNIFKKIKNSEKIMDEGLVNLFILLYFIGLGTLAFFFPTYS